MREHDPEAAGAELVGRLGEVAIEPVEWPLEQQPTATGRPVGDQLEIALAEAPDHRVLELASGPYLELDARALQTARQHLHLLADLGGVCHVRGMDVWRRDDDTRPLGDRGLREHEALLERSRT